MGIKPSINEVRDLGMHASYYNWRVRVISSIPAGFGMTSGDINIRAVSMSAPTKTIDEATIDAKGFKVYQHGLPTYNPITLTLHETVNSKVGSFLEAWLERQWGTKTGVQVPKNNNQMDFALDLLDSEDHVRCTYVLVGCWPTTFDHGSDYDSSNSDTVKFNVTLRYDYYEYEKK